MNRDKVIKQAILLMGIFLIGFVTGCVFFMCIIEKHFSNVSQNYRLILNAAMIELEAGHEGGVVFWVLLATIVLFFFAGMTTIGEVVVQGTFFCGGIMSGAALTAVYLERGITGILALFLFCMPQMLFYSLGLELSGIFASNMSTKNNLILFRNSKKTIEYIVWILCSIGFLLIGAILQHYVNHFFSGIAKKI